MSIAVNALRTSSILTALIFAGHTTGMPWTPVKTPQGDSVVLGMKSYRTEVLGFVRGYWDFYQGFGISISVCLAVFAIAMWQLASVSKSAPQVARPMIATLLAGFVALSVVNFLYFFWPPLIFTLTIVIALAVALATAK